jgi:hypothetical protein
MEVGSVLFALAFVGFAFARSFMKSGFYDAEVYAMTPGTHRKYAGIGLVVGAIMWALFRMNQQALAFMLDAALTIIVVFYISSFLRGASEEQ